MSAGRTNWTFELRWPSGDLLKRFVDVPDMGLDTLTQYMDEGIFDDIPRVRTDCEGNMCEYYELFLGTQRLEPGQWLSSYDIPQDAWITVVLIENTWAGPPASP